jgi:large subunit ribosomal protein L7/L12
MFGREGLAMANRRDENERFEVILTDLGSRRITVIKLIREVLGFELARAKDFAENLPQAVAWNVTNEEAWSMMRRFEQVDAGVRLKSIGSP